MQRFNQMIELAAKQMGYGNLNIELEIHNEKVTAMVGNEQIEKHYKQGQSKEAIALMMQMLNSELEAGKSGMITFSITYKPQSINKVYIHRQFKHLLDNS